MIECANIESDRSFSSWHDSNLLHLCSHIHGLLALSAIIEHEGGLYSDSASHVIDQEDRNHLIKR